MQLNNEETCDYYHSACVENGQAYLLSMEQNTEKKFVADLREQWKEHEGEKQDVGTPENIKFFLKKWFSKEFTIESTQAGDDMTINLVFLVWDTESSAVIKRFAQEADKLPTRCTVDCIVFSPELSRAFNLDEQPTAKFDLSAYCEGTPFHRFIILSNHNEDGVALNLDHEEILVHLLSSYTAACIEGYDSIYPQAEGVGKEVMGLGISELYLNKYDFVDYLLHSSYRMVFQREKVSENKIDANWAATIVQPQLKECEKQVQEFFDTQFDELKNVGKLNNNQVKRFEGDELIAEVNTKIDECANVLGQKLSACIDDKEHTLPRKEVLLSMILGDDNEKMENYLFNENQQSIDDCYTSPLEVFLDENNSLPGPTHDADGNPIPGQRVLAENNLDGTATNPISRIKKMRAEILRETNYIREKENELRELKGGKTENAQTFTLVQTDEEALYMPLEKDYSGPKVSKDIDADLRRNFAPAKKAQNGQIAAIAAVYAYLLKATSGQNIEPSEDFLNNLLAQQKDKSLGNIVKLAQKEGVAAPTGGNKHCIGTALNVNVSHADFMAALSEGLPIVCQLRIYDSFAQHTDGLIDYPDDEEMSASEGRLQTMVVCGCNAEGGFYIVRTAQGEAFAEKGYCYVPFDYVENPALCTGAFVITEIAGGNRTNLSSTVISAISDMNDAIRRTIIASRLKLSKRMKARKEQTYKELRKNYESLLQDVCNPTVRKTIEERSLDNRTAKIARLKAEQQAAYEEGHKELSAMHKRTVMRSLKMLGVLAVLGLAFYFCWKHINDWVSTDAAQVLEGLFGLQLVTLIIYVFVQYHQYKKRKRELEEEDIARRMYIQQEQNEKDQLPHKLYIAGQFLDKLHRVQSTLTNKRDDIKNYLKGLVAWEKSEQEECNMIKLPSNRGVFKSILDAPTLDEFLKNKEAEILGGIDLSSYLDFQGNEDFEEQQNKIRQNITDKLLDQLKNFSMYQYLVGAGNEFSFLPNRQDTLKELLSDLERSGKVFLYTNDTNQGQTKGEFIALYTKDQDEKEVWSNTYKDHFSMSPTAFSISSPFHLIYLKRSYHQLQAIHI